MGGELYTTVCYDLDTVLSIEAVPACKPFCLTHRYCLIKWYLSTALLELANLYGIPISNAAAGGDSLCKYLAYVGIRR